MTGKKDLTRIEDLGEYLHQLEEEDSLPPDIPVESEGFDEVPDLPVSDDASFYSEPPAFEQNIDEPAFNTESTDSNFEFNSEETVFDSPPEVPENETIETQDNFSLDQNNDFSNSETSETEFTETEFNENNSFTSEASPVSDEFTTEESSSFENSLAEEPAISEFSAEEVNDSSSPLLSDYQTSSEDIEEEVLPAKVESTTPAQAEVAMDSALKTRHDFIEDVKKFAENTSFSNEVQSETQPSFSIIIRNVQYDEDKVDIITILKEFNALATDENQARQSLDRGALLVPRLSEFSAIFLCHKLRRFSAEISMGLSDLIYPSATKIKNDTTSTSKKSLYQNQSASFSMKAASTGPQDVRVTTTTIIEGHQIKEYLGIVCEHEMLDDADVLEPNSVKLLQFYDRLSDKLKVQASNKKANALIGLQYQLTNVQPSSVTDRQKYLLQATANAVWIERN